MATERLKVLLLYADKDNLEEQDYAVSKLSGYIISTIGPENIDLRLWHDFLGGTSDTDKELFAASADIVVSVLSVHFLNDAVCAALRKKMATWRTDQLQKQVAVFYWACAYERFADLTAMELLPDPQEPVVVRLKQAEQSVVLDKMAKDIATIAGRPIQKPISPDELGEALIYACNRTEQMEAFERGRQVTFKPPRFYFLHGTSEQSHDGFVTRMQMELLGRYLRHQHKSYRCTLKQVEYPEANEQEMAKSKLLEKIVDAFGLNADAKSPIAHQRFGKILQESTATSPLTDKDLVLIQITILDTDFERAQAQEVIAWANNAFFDRGEFAAGAPEVIVLWCLEYTGFGKESAPFSGYIAQWEALSKRNPDWLLLPELGPVSKAHVMSWMNIYAKHLTTKAQKERIHSLFQGADAKDMEDVEELLKVIVKETPKE